MICRKKDFITGCLSVGEESFFAAVCMDTMLSGEKADLKKLVFGTESREKAGYIGYRIIRNLDVYKEKLDTKQ